jgi:SAM-dependent methyltransferase
VVGSDFVVFGFILGGFVRNDWFLPKNLEKSQAECMSSDPGRISEGGDFASYARANRGVGLTGSGIESHNLTNPSIRIRLYKHILGSVPRKKIADIGCGLGFSSKALADVFLANVDGYEVSLDAVQFSKRTWPGLCFFCRAIEPGIPLGQTYDLIVAQEFYPFTRTAELSIHLGYVDVLERSLNGGGVLLIGLSEGTKESILSNISQLQDHLQNKSLNISLVRLPFDKIYQKIPFYAIANLLSLILSFLMKKPRFCVVLIERS